MANFLLDFKHAARRLRRSPGFTSAAVLTLALGIGANTAMFSIIRAAFLKPLPFHDPERIIFASTTFSGSLNPGSSAPDYFDYREQTAGLETLSAVTWASPRFTVTGSEQPELVTGLQITTDLARTLGISPAAGRWFTADEGKDGGPPVLMLSREYAVRRFGGARQALGKVLIVNGAAGTVVGVLPPEFRLIREAAIVVPFRRGDDLMTEPRRFHNLLLMGRLKPGYTLQQVQRQADVISVRLQKAYPDSNVDKALLLQPLQTALVADERSGLILLMASVGMVLLIACGNVGGLFLARGAARRSELAIHTALGASRGRIVAQLMAESGIISLAAGASGVLLASFLKEALPAVTGLDAIGAPAPTLDWQVLLFTIAISVMTGVAFGLVPALRAASWNVARHLASGTRTSETLAGMRLRTTLVACQVAVSFLLLAGSGLLIRSFIRISAVNPGFDTRNLLTGEIVIPGGHLPDPAERARFFEDLRDDIAAVPGVKAVGFINSLPIRNSGNNVPVWAPEHPPQSSSDWQMAFQRSVLPGYFDAMRIPLLAGRDISARDAAGSPKVLVASEQMARTLFPGRNALGQVVMVDTGEAQAMPFEIVGVAGDIRGGDGISAAPRMMMYRSYRQVPSPVMRFAVRTGLKPEALVQTIRRLVLGRARDIPVQDLRSMEHIIAVSISNQQVTVLTLSMFSLVSLLLASVGLYGVMAYYVQQRTFEIGLRISLGAGTRDVARLVLGRAAVMVSIGLGSGLVCALGFARLIRELLYETAPTDPITLAGVSGFLAVICFVACAVPAWRASRIQPLQALRMQ